MKEDDNHLSKSIKNVAKDTLFYVPFKLFSLLFAFIGLPIYTRVFTPIEYGNYALIIATTGFLGIFTYAWMNQSILRFFTSYKKNDKLNTFFSTSFFTSIGIVIVLSILLATLSKLSCLPQVIIQYITLIIGIIFTTALFETLMMILRADRNAKNVSLFGSISSGLYLIISLFLIYVFNFRISAILVAYILSNLILSTTIIIKFNYQKNIRYKYFSSKVLKGFIDYGIPLIATLLFSWILTLSDRYLIEYFRNSAEVGIYSATNQLAGYPVSLISSLILMAAYPIIIDTWEKNGDEITRELISSITRYYLLLAVPSLVGTIVLSKEIMLILGPSYYAGYSVVPWVSFGSLMLGLCFYSNKGFELKKNTKILSILVGITSILNIVLNLLLIPKYGFYGAGVATGLTYFIYFILSISVSKKYLKFTINGRSAKNIFTSSILMGLALMLVKEYLLESLLSLFLLICLGIIIYFLIIFLTREINNEIVFIKNHFILFFKNVL